MINEHKKGFKAKKYMKHTKPTEPATTNVKSPVAKNSKMAGKAGTHKNPKTAVAQPRKAKHKKAEMMETVISVIGESSKNASVNEIKKGQKDSNGYSSCWTGYHAAGTKKGKNGGWVRKCVPNEGVAEAVWDRHSQSHIPRDGRTFGQTNHPREEHCDSCGAPTGHAGPGEDSNVDDNGNVYCDDCYAGEQGVAEGGGARQAAIAIAKKKSGKYNKDGKRIKEGWFDGKSDAENDAKVNASGRRGFMKALGGAAVGAGIAAAGLGGSQNARAGNVPEIKMQDARHGTVAYQGKNIPITLNDTTRAMGVQAKAMLNGQPVNIAISMDGARAWIPPREMPVMREGILAEDVMGLDNDEFEPKQHHDPEGNMARSELYRNAKYAMDLLKMIEPEDEIEPWVAANLTNAATWLDKVYHHLDYRTKFDPEIGHDLGDKGIKESEAEPSGDIARMNLQMIVEYSTKLFKMIKPETRLDGWVAMKLTKASECVSSSKHYLEHQYFEKHSSDMYESKILKKFAKALSKK